MEYSMSYHYGGHVQYTLIHETEKAFLVRDGKGEFWIPKSLTQSVTTRGDQIQFKRWLKFSPDYLPEHETADIEMAPLVKEEVFVVEEPDFDVLDMKKLKRKKKKKKSKVLYDTEWARNEGLI